MYIASAFMILELVDMVSDPFGLPAWSLKVVFFIAVAGLILAVLLSWIYDLNPEGAFVKTESADVVKDENKPKFSNNWKIASYISFMVIIALLVLHIIPRTSKKEILEKSIAVLPFRNDSSDDENAHFINGTMEAILDNLCKIEDLRVPGRTSVEQYRDISMPISEIAKNLNVSYVLEGSGQKLGNRIRLTVQLLEGKSDRHLWSQQYDREIHEVEDLIDIQSEIAQLIASELHVVITPKEKQIIERIPTTSIQALGLYRRGRDEHMKYWLDHTNLQALNEAIGFYRLVLKEDPSFGKAYTGLAMAIRSSFWAESWRSREFSETENKLYRDSVLYLVEKALSYDPDLEEAYLVRGDYYYGLGEYDMALAECNKSLEINPNYSWAYYSKSRILFYQKKNHAEGIEQLLKAIDLETGEMLISGLRSLGWYYEESGFRSHAVEVYKQILMLTGDTATYYEHMAGPAFCNRNWEEYIYWSRKVLEINPHEYWPISQLSWTHALLGNIDSAYHYAMRLQELREDMVQYAGYIELTIGYALWKTGQKAEARKMINTLIEYLLQLTVSEIYNKEINLMSLAECYAILGQHEKAMDYIDQIDRYSLKPIWFIISMEDGPYLKEIREDSEFQLFLEEIKSTWQAEHKQVRIWLEENDML